VRDTINYEGQAAIELEQLAAAGADPGAAEASGYRAALSPGVSGEPFQLSGADLVREAAADLSRGTGRPIVAARFQYGIVKLIEDGCSAVRDRYGLTTVALSGGVFQNVTVLGAAVARLEARGFRVLTHGRVPCNDGGISLGQAVVAAARDAAG
jgi:hydrogenase maturation protein HypF